MIIGSSSFWNIFAPHVASFVGRGHKKNSEEGIAVVMCGMVTGVLKWNINGMRCSMFAICRSHAALGAYQRHSRHSLSTSNYV